MGDIRVVIRSAPPCVGVVCIVGATTRNFVAFAGVDDVDGFPGSVDGGKAGQGDGERSELHDDLRALVKVDSWSESDDLVVIDLQIRDVGVPI